MKHKIVLVPFPFDDLSGTKVRPAVCLTNQITTYNHVVIAFITSQIHIANEASEIIIDSTDVGFGITGLRMSSAIRLHRLVTIPTRIIQRQLGDLPNNYHADVETKLRALFDL